MDFRKNDSLFQELLPVSVKHVQKLCLPKNPLMILL